MKRYLLFVLLPFCALTGCQREPSVENLQTQEVKTRFVFNLADGAPQTKQDAGAVQADGRKAAFRGIEQAMLLTYVQTTDGQILKADATSPKSYNLAKVMNAQNASDELMSRRILEMSLPLRTNTLLFYGKSPDMSGMVNNTFSAQEYYGYLDDYHVTETEGDINFQLGTRLQDKAGFDAVEQLLAGILSAIMNTNLADETNDLSADGMPSGTPDEDGAPYPYGFAVSKDAFTGVSWSSYQESAKSPVETTENLYPLEVKLAKLYAEMTTIRYVEPTSGEKEVELRAGSGEAILKMLNDLWTVVNGVRCAKPISEAEAVAKFFADKVHRNLSAYFNATVPVDGSPVTGVSFKAITDVLAAFNASTSVPAGAELSDADKTAIGALGTGYKLADFPANFNIIRGAAYVTFNETSHCFEYPAYFNTNAVGGAPQTGASSGYSAEDYYYPAELLYFGNSPIRTSEKDLGDISNYPETASAWETEANWSNTDWTETHVTSSTRTVAMTYNIRYGVAMLETKVKYADGLTYLEDNNRAIQKRYGGDEQNRKINITDESFILTGVIIGGQPKQVGWDFLPKANTAQGFIYDSAVFDYESGSTIVPKYVSKTPASFKPNYTVVFDNYKDDANQETVYVALEFKNNSGKDFYGNFNLIKDGGYFYLIGALDPTKSNTAAFAYETDGAHAIPPYNTAVRPRIFIQDYKTTVNFTLGQYSLQYAYLTVPDLRASSFTMGLSVDIEWKQGLTYDNLVVGGSDDNGQD